MTAGGINLTELNCGASAYAIIMEYSKQELKLIVCQDGLTLYK